MHHLLGCCGISNLITVAALSIYVACYLENYTPLYRVPLIVLISDANDASHSCNMLAGVKCVQVFRFVFLLSQIALHFDWGVEDF